MLAPLILALVACGNASQFRAKNVSLERVEAPNENRPTVEMKPNDIVRLSGQIQYQDLNADWEGEQVTLKGQFQLGNQNYGEVEMRGRRTGEEIVFSPVREDLSGKVRAKATCISADEVCSDFFVDILVRDDDGRIKHDQFVVQKKAAPATPEKKPETASPAPNPTPAPNPPPVKTPQPAPPATTTPATLPPVVIKDDIEGLQPGAFVGISDDEIRELFNPENIKSEVTPPPQLPPSETPTTSSTTTTNKATPPQSGKEQSPTPAPTTPAPEAPKKVLQQSIGAPNDGSLENAEDISVFAKMENSFFKLVWPEGTKHFSTTSMLKMIQQIAEYTHAGVTGFQLSVGELSKKRGGLVGHKSHQNGLDADLGYVVSHERSNYRNMITAQSQLNVDFMAAENWSLFKKIFENSNVEVIFVHSAIKKALCAEAIRVGDLKDANDQGTAYQVLRRIWKEDGHDEHFHLRLACQKTDKRCRNLNGYAQASSGCF